MKRLIRFRPRSISVDMLCAAGRGGMSVPAELSPDESRPFHVSEGKDHAAVAQRFHG